MKLFDILLPYQKKILLDKSRFKIILCARQVGKSFVMACQAVYNSLVRPKNLTAIVSTGERAAGEMLKKCLQWADAFRVADNDIVYSNNATSITFNNGSRIIILPAGNPAALRGYSGDIILDEFAIVENDKEIWEAIVPSITNPLAGMKSVTIASTPSPGAKTLDTIFAQLWHSNVGVWSKHFVDVYKAKEQGLNIDIDTIKKAINDDVTFQIEFECKFISDKTSAFKEAYFTDDLVEEYKDDIDSANILGYDVARDGDNTAMVVANYNFSKKTLNILDILELNNVPYEDQENAVAELNKKYNVRYGYIDGTGIGGPVAEYCEKHINPLIKGWTWTAANKTPCYEKLKAAFELRQIKYLNGKLLEKIKNDAMQVQKVISNTGRISYVARHSKEGHADIISALSLVIALVYEHYAAKDSEVKNVVTAPINHKFVYKRRF